MADDRAENGAKLSVWATSGAEDISSEVRPLDARLLDALPLLDAGLWYLDTVGDHLQLSPRAMELLGCEGGEESGPQRRGQWLALLHPDDRDAMDAGLRALENGEATDADVSARLLLNVALEEDASEEFRWRVLRVRARTVAREPNRGRVLGLAGTLENVSALRTATRRQHRVESRLEELVQHQGEGFGIVDTKEVFEFANPAAEATFGVAPGELVGQSLEAFLDRDGLAEIRAQTAERAGGERSSYELEIRRPGGDRRQILVTATPRYDSDGRFVGSFGVFRDITALKRAEKEREALRDRLRRSHQLEAIGRLAGGIAHDFNNLLSPILGYGEMALMDLAPDADLRLELEEIVDAAHRARRLTQQLLAVGRKQLLRTVELDLNELIHRQRDMLQGVIGEDVELVLELEAAPAIVKADREQLELGLVDLATFSRDAMPKGGRLTIRTSRTVVDLRTSSPVGLRAGEYVRLEVLDSGEALDDDILAQLFEPFFTTKERGKVRGHGLGLAAVHGVIRQHRGHIGVSARPDGGTRFEILLLAQEGGRRSSAPSVPGLVGAEGRQRLVLLVEDHDAVRRQVARMLERLDLRVISARDGEEAVQIAGTHAGRIDLLLSDVMMPGMSGREVYDVLAPDRKRMRVLFMSGYTDDLITSQGVLKKGTRLLAKPFTLDELRDELEAVFAARPRF